MYVKKVFDNGMDDAPFFSSTFTAAIEKYSNTCTGFRTSRLVLSLFGSVILWNNVFVDAFSVLYR